MILVIWTFNFFTISIRTKSLRCLFEFNLPILVLTSLDLIELFYIILQNFISNFKISGLQKLLCVYEVLWENDQVKCVWPTFKPGIVMTVGLKIIFLRFAFHLIFVWIEILLFFKPPQVLSKQKADSWDIKCNHGRGEESIIVQQWRHRIRRRRVLLIGYEVHIWGF